MTETVNHPAHYGGDTPYEAIKVIEAWQLGFGLGNAVKYIARAEHKGNQLEDLRKAAWYLGREIDRLEPPPIEMSPGAFIEVGPIEMSDPASTLADLLGYLERAAEYNRETAEGGPLDTRPAADRARWAYVDAAGKVKSLLEAVEPAPDVTYAICGALGRHGKCVFAKSHQSICRNSNGLGIS